LPSCSGPPRAPAFTGIRFFPAIAVVLYHYWGDLMPGAPKGRVFESGFMGVSFFYILSGFILTHVYLRSGQPTVDWKKFYVARFARVYPAYALSLLIQFPLIGGLLLRYRSPTDNSLIALRTLGAHLLLLQAWWPNLAWRWNQPSWSISDEAFFYLIFPVLAVWSLRQVKIAPITMRIGLAWLLTLTPAVGLLLHGVGWDESWPRPDSLSFVVFAPIFRIPEFIMGVLLCILHRRIASAWSPARVLQLGKFATYLGLATAAVVILNGRWIPFALRYSGIADLAFVELIFGLAAAPTLLSRIFSHPFLVFLGEASYSIYILQSPIMDYFRPMTTRFHGPALFTAYLGTLLVSGILCFLFIESPIRRRINGWYASAQLVSREPTPERSSVLT
jgi:peptidoglycan/LPS O-acetylase OafA/YrhL